MLCFTSADAREKEVRGITWRERKDQAGQASPGAWPDDGWDGWPCRAARAGGPRARDNHVYIQAGRWRQ